MGNSKYLEIIQASQLEKSVSHSSNHSFVGLPLINSRIGVRIWNCMWMEIRQLLWNAKRRKVKERNEKELKAIKRQTKGRWYIILNKKPSSSRMKNKNKMAKHYFEAIKCISYLSKFFFSRLITQGNRAQTICMYVCKYFIINNSIRIYENLWRKCHSYILITLRAVKLLKHTLFFS